MAAELRSQLSTCYPHADNTNEKAAATDPSRLAFSRYDKFTSAKIVLFLLQTTSPMSKD